jgi:hypothetical protein
MRLPSILAVFLAIVSLWSILRRWLPPLYAASGILAFMATRGFDYAYDTRSYALLMGTALAALALWLRANDRTGFRRFLALTGMAICLAAGLSSNYYGVLAFFPIALGELSHTVFPVEAWGFSRVKTLGKREGAFAPAVWLALLLAAIPLYFYLPLIRHNIAEFTPHAWNRPRLSMVGLSYFELVEGPLWPVLFLALFLLIRRARSSERRPPLLPDGVEDARGISSPLVRSTLSNRTPHPSITPELVALLTLLAYPLLGYAIALAGAGMISPRCVVPVCCGFGVAFALLAQRVFGPTRRAAFILVSVLALAVTLRESICATVLLDQRRAFFSLRDAVQATAPAEILVADSSFVLPLYFYSAPSIQKRIIFPIDFAAIHRYEQDDSGEQNLWAGRNGVFPFPIVPFSSVRLTPEITVIARPEGWLATSIRQSGLPLQRDPTQPDAWSRTGGVFTPMAHFETRILRPWPTTNPGGP